MKLVLGDGRVVEFDKGVTGAFANLAMGNATAGQQKLALTTLFQLANPNYIAPAKASERETGMADGMRLVGQQVAHLIGGDMPWTLKHLGDLDD